MKFDNVEINPLLLAAGGGLLVALALVVGRQSEWIDRCKRELLLPMLWECERQGRVPRGTYARAAGHIGPGR